MTLINDVAIFPTVLFNKFFSTVGRRILPHYRKAKAMHESGYTIDAISSKTGIDRSNLTKKIAKDGWQRNPKIPAMIAKAANLSNAVHRELHEDIAALDKDTRKIVVRDIDQVVANVAFLQTAAHKVIARMLYKCDPDHDEFQKDMTPAEFKTMTEAIAKAREAMLGREAGTVINNNNTNTSNSESLESKTDEELMDVMRDIERKLKVINIR